MIIERVTIRHLMMPLVTHFETSFGRSFNRHGLLLEVYSGDLVGLGECSVEFEPGYASETVGTAWHVLKEFILPAVLGEDIPSIDDYQERVRWIRGHRMAKAGFELALWDLIGKREGQSLQMLLGGDRSAVKVGVSIGIQDTHQDLLNTVSKYLEQGYRRVKIKIKPGRDIEDADLVRSNFPDLPLQVDANSAYDLDMGMELLPLDRLNLLLIEQPLAEDDLWDHRQLQKQFQTALCLDESIRSPRHARQALEMEACRIINIKPARVGGLQLAREIHDLCLERGVPVWCGGMLETGVGRAANLALASLPGFSLPGDISASDRYYQEDITDQRFVLNPDSTITVPKLPGIGVTLNQDALARVTQARLDFP